MFDYQTQPGAPKPPKMSRVNWTQATTTTLAAAVGCLLAIGACMLLYRYMFNNAIKAKQAKLDEMDHRFDDLVHKLVRSKPVTTKPAAVVEPSDVDAADVEAADVEAADVDTEGVDTSVKAKTDKVDVKAADESAQKEKAYVPKTMPGEAIKTTPAV